MPELALFRSFAPSKHYNGNAVGCKKQKNIIIRGPGRHSVTVTSWRTCSGRRRRRGSVASSTESVQARAAAGGLTKS